MKKKTVWLAFIGGAVSCAIVHLGIAVLVSLDEEFRTIDDLERGDCFESPWTF